MDQTTFDRETGAVTLYPDPGAGKKGRGLNSIPIRFALMSVVVGSIGFGLQFWFVLGSRLEGLGTGDWAILMVALCLPAGVTFFAARKLAGMIGALRNSTLAILKGDINSPVDVDCACEVGGLADSFRAMVARLNSNILRMNILAYTDSVTGLPNRAVINHVLELASKKGPEDCKGAMFFIDLDGFKRINDTFGHDAGDELLRQASLRIVEGGFGVRRDDLDSCTTAFGELCTICPTKLVFARFAGDEFVALLPGQHGRDELANVGQAILQALDQPFDVFGNEISIGASIGVATIDRGINDPRDLIVHADIAMYRAKENGRNCVAFFDVDLKERVAERAELEKDLRYALENDQLTLEFQPKLCTVTNAITGVEALARWHHPSKGVIVPDRFIPIAEKSGSMTKLGDSVLRLALAQARSWNENGQRIPVAVNVSPVQFESPDLVVDILSTLDDFDVDPELLELEITETLAMFDYRASKRRIDELRSHGVRVAIDDFGTGYSNLSQLARLSVDTIKIDQSLVNGIGQNSKAEAMLEATINMARALGYNIVAEGIETLEQLNALQVLGCNQIQGYFVAKPATASDLAVWLSDRGANTVGKLQQSLVSHANVA